MRAVWVGLMLMCTVGSCAVHAQTEPRAKVSRSALLSELRPAARQALSERALAALPVYDLDLVLADDLRSYTLHETLEYTNTGHAPQHDVVLRLFSNRTPGRAPIDLEASSCAPRACELVWASPSVLQVRPKAALAPGERITLQLQLRGRLRVLDSQQTNLLSQGLESLSSLLTGEASSDYGLLSFGDGIASLAHFYAVLAERTGQRWVTEERKPFGDVGAAGVSLVHARIHVPFGVGVATGGAVVGRSADARGQRIEVHAGPVRDFAIVASRAFQQRERRVGDVNVRAFFLESDADGGGRALDTAARALEVFERRFGPYPYRTLTIAEAALVGGAGGCEFSGLVSVASMLYRPLPIDPGMLGMLGGQGAGLGGSLLEFTTAHEVAHQFWYGLVGSDAREHPFQDESLTQWSAQLYFEDRFGPERARREADTQIAMNYRLMRMLGRPDAPVDRPVDAYDSALTYAGLVYGKGAYLYAALRSLVGDANFFGALRDYVQQYRFQIAPPSALFDRIAERSGRTRAVRAVVARWLNQRHGDTDLQPGDATRDVLTGSRSRAPTEPGRDDVSDLTRAKPGQGAEAAPNLEQLQGLLQGMLGGSGGAQAQPDLAQLQGLLQGMLGGSGAQAQPDLAQRQGMPGDATTDATPNADTERLRAMAQQLLTQQLLNGGALDPSALQGWLDAAPGSTSPGPATPPGFDARLQAEPNQRGLR